jgi:hypothetical protein
VSALPSSADETRQLSVDRDGPEADVIFIAAGSYGLMTSSSRRGWQTLRVREIRRTRGSEFRPILTSPRQ